MLHGSIGQVEKRLTVQGASATFGDDIPGDRGLEGMPAHVSALLEGADPQHYGPLR